jgi:2-polyprenyl-6-hydroxyphenyl methylase/3-demethylubiquinone-9 3-methyltransferase
MMTAQAPELSRSLTRFLQRYEGISLGTRIFLKLRWQLTPYLAMARHLPQEGRILDLGCGHGLLSLALALESPKRQIFGIDHDPARVQAANQAAHSISNLAFQQGNVLDPITGRYAGIAMIDVMHYFESSLQLQIFKNAFEALETGGTLIVREVDPAGGGIASWFNRFYEKLATMTGFTRAEKPGLHFRTPEGWTSALKSVGFEVQSEPCSSRLFADILYVCRKAK